VPPALQETLAGERRRHLLHRSRFLQGHPQLIVAADAGVGVVAVANARVEVAAEVWAVGVVLAG